MEARELRIGNYVIKRELYRCGPFSEWEKNEFKISNWTDLENTYDYDPIPLSEEWLLNFGFNKNRSYQNWFIYGKVCISLSGIIELLSFNGDSFKLPKKYTYVHDIQNLFFALTGQELTRKQ